MNFRFLVLIPSLLAVSCMKTAPFGEVARSVVEMEVSAPEGPTRLILDDSTLSQSWEVGDEIEVRGYYKDASAEYHFSDIILSACSGGSKVLFRGTMDPTIPSYPSSTLVAIAPSGKVESVSKNNVNILTDEVQTGAPADFGKYAVSISATSFKAVKNSDGTYGLPKINRMRNILPVIHFTVEEGLGVTEIEIRGFNKETGKSVALSGKMNFKPSRMGFYSVTSSASEMVRIYRGGDEISGHVYACLMPDFPTRYNNDGYYTGTDAPTLDDGNLRGRNCADSLSFIFRDATGFEVEIGSAITPKSLLSGSVKDLGKVKRMPFPHYIGMEFNPGIEDFGAGETFNP